MGQIQNVLLLLVISALMAIATTILVYFFDVFSELEKPFANFLEGSLIELTLK